MRLSAKKGIIFTLDAILALVSCMILLSATLFYLSQSHTISWVETDLSQLGLDSLAALELSSISSLRISNDLNWTLVNDNTSNLKLFMNVMLENNTCAEIRLYDASPPNTYTLKKYYRKDYCTLKNDTKSAIARRLFFSDLNASAIYIAEMEVWYK